MAQQHFYSRVPAKASMFNKADGFDTFACSEGLNQERIETELSTVYNSKPSKEEISLIRDGKIPPVYFNYTSKGGNWVQSCMTFLPLDYTGERTSYLVHSLVMDKEEEKEILCSPESDILNPDMFVKDLSGFDLTSFKSYANGEYPVLKYEKKKNGGTVEFVKKYDRDMLKRLIFSLISICCGNGKTVYISLSPSLKRCSEDMLVFFNTILQIFPYNLRKKLPFVTYTGDCLKYSDFKIKGVVDSIGEIPLSKGIVLHFGSKISLGLQDDLVRAEKFLVDFFYELLCNDGLRREFLVFMDSVESKSKEELKLNMKSLREFVILFCECSGLYKEKQILPDENAVQDFVVMYDKYRNCLSDEYRGVAMNCLARYPQTHTAIPGKIFSKLVKMYPSEPIASKHTIMNVMLDLIHTDAMRQKLFNFLTDNYAGESPETKKKIVGDLARVYYGGFLRPQILEFFDGIFGDEPDDIRDEIFEKILLTVRTEQIQSQIIAFAEKYSDKFTTAQKEKFLITYMEIISEADGLAKAFSLFLDKYLPFEDKDLMNNFNQLFLKTVERDCRKKEHKILPFVIVGNYKYLNSILSEKVFGDWAQKPIFDEYVSFMWSGSFSEGVDAVITAWKNRPDMSDESSAKLKAISAEKLSEKVKKVTIRDLADAEKKITEALNGDLSKNAKAFGDELCESIIRPAICEAIPTVFSIPEGMEFLETYAKQHKYITKCTEYSELSVFHELQAMFEKKDFEGFAKLCLSQENKKKIRSILLYIKKNAENSEKGINAETTVFLGIVLPLCDGKIPNYSDLFGKAKSVYTSSLTDSNISNERIETDVLDLILKKLNLVYSSSSEDVKAFIVSDLNSLSDLISGFVAENKTGVKTLSQNLKNSYSSFPTEIKDVISSRLKSGNSTSFFSKIFKKK